jgi:phosphatidylinositol alpha-1,6-mannosyltransferase
LLKLLPLFRLHDARIALFLHGIETWRRLDWLSNRQLGRVHILLSNSDYTARRFIAVNPDCHGIPCQTVHLGIASPVIHTPPMPEDPPVALMLSRLLKSEDYKGHRELIGAWPRVLERIPNAELWIAGDGDLRSELEQLAAALAVGARVRFWGHVSEAHKEHLLARSRCLAMPSRGEGFGLVYLEAIRLGRPCLVSTCDAGREVVNPPEAGLAANPTKPQELVDALCRLLAAGSEWQRWSKQARARYDSQFTAQHFQGRLLEAVQPVTAQTVRY